MRLVLLGAPGSGKGTQGVRLGRHLGVPHISSGDLLRAHIADSTPLGHDVTAYVSRGELVPDDLIVRVVADAVIAAVESGGGFVLDGFPRTLVQAEQAYELAKPAGLEAELVLHLQVPDDVVRERLAARAAGGRADDADPAVIERRLRLYHEDTQPLLDYYASRGILVDIDGTRPPDEVGDAAIAAVDARRTET